MSRLDGHNRRGMVEGQQGAASNRARRGALERAQAFRPAGPRTEHAERDAVIFKRLKWTSFTHSCVYSALLICAFAAGKPEPATFVLGLSHGLLWIFMSLACLAAARMRIVSLRLAVAVAVLGGFGPFFGSYEFIREQRRNARRSGSASQLAGATDSAPASAALVKRL